MKLVEQFTGVANGTVAALIHWNVLMYALCFWIQQPVLSYLSKELGATALMFGSLETAVSILSLAGGSFVGQLADHKGAKAAIITSHMGSLIMYILMSSAITFEILLASRFAAL